MIHFIEIETINKAKRDIDEICRREGYHNLTIHDFGSGGVGRFFTKLTSVTSILWRLRKGDVLFLQYPMKKFYKMACSLAKMRGARVVTIIHDLGAFRRHKLTAEQENRRLSKTDFLIVHNPTMRQYLIDHGFKGGMHCLQIFDFLSESQPRTYDVPHRPWRVVYAGGLGRRNDFLYQMPAMDNWKLDLYGEGFMPERNKCEGLKYHGFMKADQFISKVEADFGLVWDGDSPEACVGSWGEYLRINDPHKTSFYLRAGIPVIVWSQAAMAPFIREEGVGIVIDSISDIGKTLAQLSPADYRQMKQQALLMGQRLAQGYYVKEGLKAALGYLKNQK
jgi:hypothetical protein